MPISVGAAGSVIPPVDILLRTARRNEEKGYDSLWWPDHLMGWHPESVWHPDITPLGAVQANPHIYLDPVASIAAAAGATETISLGTSVTEPVRNHPAQLARAWLSLDHITKGRAILGIGAGEAENIEPYGMSFERPVSRLEEALRVVRLLWENDEPVHYEGSFYRIDGGVLGMGPYTPGRFPPIWLAALGPRMCRIAGELADGWLPVLTDPETYGLRYGQIRESAQRAGRDPDAITAGGWTYTVVAEDHETAHRLLDDRMTKAFHLALSGEFFAQRGHTHPLGEDFYGLTDYIPSRLGREEALKAIDAIPFQVAHDATLHGTPAEIAAKIGSYAENGLRHIALWNVTFFGDLGRVGSSYRLLDETKDEIKRLPY